MRTVGLIAKKRDGYSLTKTELEYLINGYVKGEIPDYQIAALCMGIYFQGMEPEEITDLTLIMAHSGDLLNLSGIPGKKVDKHSTGGVGDTTTLIVAPLVASCGVPVAKMSGRGLGHTGGTVDKLESIPGYQIQRTPGEFIEQVNKIGVSIVGQTGDLAPADKLIYALRDVTSTVESIPLIASSIMSKKIAAGADGFVLDVKAGFGAFMKTEKQALELAKTMVQIGNLAGRSTVALVTDMNQPLGRGIGNALEIKEAILALQGHGSPRITELSLELSTEMLLLAGTHSHVAETRQLLEEKLQSGAALRKFGELIKAQGGDARIIEDLNLLPQASYVEPVIAQQSGYVHKINPLIIGEIAMRLGAGRQTKEDQIDLAVGLELKHEVGDYVQQGGVLAFIHSNKEHLIPKAHRETKAAFTIKPERCTPPPLIYQKITAKNV